MFFNRPQHFPKQLFFRFLIQQIFGVVPALLLAAFGARIYLEKKLAGITNLEEAAHEFDRAFFILGIIMVTGVIGITLWTGYRLVLPLGRILIKARSILKREYSSQHRIDDSSGIEDGEWSDLETTIHRIGKNMEFQDLTLSQEREQIEAIISAISEAVVAVDKSGNILFFNSQFAVLFGPQEIKKKFSRLSEFFRSPDVLEAFSATINTGVPSTVNMHLNLHRNNLPRFFSLSLAPLKIASGQVYGVVGVFHDVTELKHMDQVRIDFVANVSHELRTPLTSIKGYAQTLKDEVKDTSHKKFLETIERNTDRLIALVQDLLNLSSLESGADLEMQDIELRPLTERVILQLDSYRAEKNHKITTQFLTTSLYADPKRIEQVIFNLLENAIKYVPAGGNIEILWDEKKDKRLIVSDDGPGIPPEQHNRIFERFYRLDSARTREQGGTGLGLAIVKHIVQRHGGKVIVQSRKIQGTEFICTFPSRK